MPERIILGVFEVVGPQVGGTLSWPSPRSDSIEYTNLGHWIEVAQILDRGGFDFLFFADGYGYPSIDGDLPDVAIRNGINYPALDPVLLLTALAQATERIGLVVTQSTGIDHPIQTARKFSTLDHMTRGRIGWNIVTGAMQNTVAELFGHDQMVKHDDRYAIADEYLDLALRYWENVWEDDAVIADKTVPIYADPAKLHRLEYAGEHFRSSGYLMSPPSPQRTPVLFQAGTSTRGRQFAAQNAECVFVQGTTVELTAKGVADIRAQAAALGRDPRSVKTIVGMTVIVAPTHDEAVALRREFDELQSDEVVASLYAGNTGIDLLSLDPDRPLSQVFEGDDAGPAGQMGQSNIDRFLGKGGQPGPTVREILDQLKGRGTRGFQVTGDPVEVADEIERILDATDLDGLMLEPVFDPADLAAFAELVVPILRERGKLAPADQPPAGDTLRARLGLSADGRLRDDYPARPHLHPGA